MRFELIHELNPQYRPIEQILTNRGIDISQIRHYIHSTDNDINEPELLGEDNLRRAAALITQAVRLNNRIVVVVDCDCDGYTSSAILINYLHDLFPAFVESNLTYFAHDSKQHGLSDCIDWITSARDVSLVICPDSSSNDYDEHKKLKDLGIDVIVLDHHDADKISENAVIINNQLCDYPNKDFSGAGVVWQFCRYLDKLLNTNNAEQYRDLAALGLDADMMSLRSIETKHIIGTGLARPRNPFIVTMAQKNEFSLKGKLTPIGVAFYIAPFVNAMTRSGTIDEKLLLFESMLKFKAFEELPSTKRGHALGETETLVEQAVRVATNVKNRQTKVQEEGLARIEYKIESENLLDHKVLLFLMEPGEIDRNIAGLIANKIMAKYQRPVCILTAYYPELDALPWDPLPDTDDTVIYSGSARGCDKVGIYDFKSICLQTGVCNYAEGHPGAFGVSINGSNIQTFISRTDEILSSMNNEAIYYVDYIFDRDNIIPNAILDIAELEDFWGKDLDEPYVAVKNLRITPDMVTIYDKRNLTIKITLPGISIVKFKATETECEKFQYNNTGYIEVNIIGRCNANEWNGYVTPQILIEDYEIIDSSKYFF